MISSSSDNFLVMKSEKIVFPPLGRWKNAPLLFLNVDELLEDVTSCLCISGESVIFGPEDWD